MTGRLVKPTVPIAIGLLLAVLVLSGCNSSTQALDTAAQPETQPPAASAEAQTNTGEATEAATATEQDAEKPVEKAEIIRQPSTVSQRGTYIRALVNGAPITNFDIKRRAKFLQLRGERGGSEAALEELVDQHLKLQASRASGVLAGDGQVDAAFANFARGNRSNPQRITRDLNRIGVGADHFKEFIRTQISWQSAVGRELRGEQARKSERDAIFELRKAGAEKPETTEYVLQQVIFVVPQAQRKSLLKARRDEALTFGQKFTGCDQSFALAKQLRDVAVKDLGRYLQPELPALWKDEVIETNAGKTTKPKETERGIEVVAVCSSRNVSDDLTAQVVNRAQAFESLNDKGSEASDRYLANLRKAATIIYR